MPKLLTPEEIELEFGGGYRAEAPEKAGFGTRFGGAVDSVQAGLYGLGEAAGLPLGDLRRQNQFESDQTYQRYYRDTGAPRSWDDVHGVGDAGTWLGGLAVDSTPYLGAAALGGLAGGPAGAFAALSALGTADVLQNQRDAGGRTDLALAAPLGLAYGAMDSLAGVGGALARRSLGTGIRALDRAGVRYLDNLDGPAGVAARTGATAVKQGLVEGVTETGQEFANQFGRMSVSDEGFADPEALDRYRESFIGGAALGGLFGGAARGWRRSDAYVPPTPTPVDTGAPVNLLDRTVASAPAQEPIGTQDFINEHLGIQRSTAPKDYAKIFGQAAGEPSGVWESDPVTGIERQLDVQELIARRNGVQPQANPAPAAPTTAPEVQTPVEPVGQRSEDDLLLRDEFGVKPTQYTRQLLDAVRSEGFDPKAPELESLWSWTAQNLTGPKRLKTAMEKLDGLIIELRSQTNGQTVVAPPGAATTQPTAAGVQAVAPATAPTAQAVGATQTQPAGASTPATTSQQPTNQGAVNGTQAPQTQQAKAQGQQSLPAGNNAQPAAQEGQLQVSQPVSTTAPTNLLAQREVKRKVVAQPAPAAAPAAYVAPESEVAQEPSDEYADDAEAWDDFRADDAPEFSQLSPSMQKAWQQARQTGRMTGALADDISKANADEGVDDSPEVEARQVLEEIFGTRDAGLLHDVIVNKMTREAAAKKHGTSRATADAVTGGGTEAVRRRAARIQAAVKRNGWEPDYIQNLLGRFAVPDAGVDVAAVDAELDGMEGVGANDNTGEDGFDRSEQASADPTLGQAGFGVTHGGSQGNYKDGSRKLKALSAEKVKRIEVLRVEQGALLEIDTDEAAARSSEIDAEISQLEAESVTPGELAASRTQQAFELMERIESTKADIQRAVSLGLSEVASHSGNKSVVELQALVAAEQTRVDRLLKAAEEILKRGSTRKKLGAAKTEPAKTEPAKTEPAKKADAPRVDSGQTLWESLRQSTPDLAPYEDLTKLEKDYLTELADRTDGHPVLAKEPSLMTLVAAKLVGEDTDAKFGKDSRTTNSYTAKELLDELKGFIRSDIPGRKLLVVDSVADLLSSSDPRVQKVGAALAVEGAYGVAADGRAYLVANRVSKGTGRAKFMHEVGSHLGLENLLPRALYDRLVSQVKKWAKSDSGSLESELAVKAAERVMNAGTAEADRGSELLAYFIEEAVKSGVDPTADAKTSGPLRDWFRTLWAAFKVAVRKLGLKPESLVAQDVVNLAFGAARLEIAGTWHGTAAAFRKFNHKFMGEGEGTGNRGSNRDNTGAFAWGTYIAQSPGIAKGYWRDDVKRKAPKNSEASVLREIKKAEQELADAALIESPSVRENVQRRWHRELESLQKDLQDARAARSEGSLMRLDTPVADEELLNWDAPMSEQSDLVKATLEQAGLWAPSVTRSGVIGWLTNDGGSADRGTAAELYKNLAGEHSGDAARFKKSSGKEPSKRAVSEYLDSIGIKGVKFLDANSRGKKMFQGYDRKEELRKAAKADDYLGFDYFDQMLQAALADGMRVMRTQYDISPELDAELEAYVGWMKAPMERTYNLVIFSDKNIFRVGSETAADPERMRFGKEQTLPPAPTRAIVERNIAKLPKQAQQPTRTVISTVEHAGRTSLDKVVFTSDLIGRAVKAGLSSARTFERLLAKRATDAREMEREVEKIADRYVALPEQDRSSDPTKDSVNQFLFDSTRTGKWGYGKYRNDEMGARFDAFQPATQQFIKDVFAHGSKVLEAKKKILMDMAVSEYDAMLKQAQDAVNDAAPGKERNAAEKTLTGLKKDKENSLAKYRSLFKIRDGIPYAPIKRVGEYVVVAKSNEYIQAEADKDMKLLRKLEQDPDHYHVTFTDTRNEGHHLAERLREQGHFGDNVQTFPRMNNENRLFRGSDLEALTRLRSKADSTGSKQLQNLITELYLQTLADNSARKSEMRRRGVAGEVDMLRSFAIQGRSDAQFMASVQYNQATQDALQAMRSEAAKAPNRERGVEVLNELESRYEQSLEITRRPLLDKLTRASSVYFLVTSPFYFIQNLTQPWVMSVPAMARTHDYTAVSKALWDAYADLKDVLKSARLFDQGFDFTKVPDDVRVAIGELVNRGKIDIGLDTELGEFRIDGEGATSKAWNKVDKGIRTLVQKGESINRLSTAIAAYRLELGKSNDHQKALDFADHILTETHGDYGRFNAPRAFNTGVGKVALQFRKFQLIQLTFYAKLLKDAFTNPDERRAAFKTLGYSLGHTALLAGTQGLPGFAAIAWAASALLGDDDEPYDLTQKMRSFIGDETLANLIMRGAPTLGGADLSGKVGAGNMLSVMPFTDLDLASPEGRNAAFAALVGGASLGMLSRVADGMGLVMSGDMVRGAELVLPKGLGDAIKAYRIGTDGVTRRNGDVLLPPEEVTAVESLMQAIGTPLVDQAVRNEKQSYVYRTTTGFNDATTKIKNDYAKASRTRDSEAMADARKRWEKLQKNRKEAGLKPEPLSTLMRAPQRQAERERNTVRGIQFNPSNRGLVESL